MKRIKTDMYTFMNGAMGWRLGVRTAERVLKGAVTMIDMCEYGPSYTWENANGICKTDWKGNVISTDM